VKRKQLIAGSLGTLLAARASRAGAQAPQQQPPGGGANSQTLLSRNNGALVLPGGGARGAYEAGVIEGVRRAAGIADGTPLPGVDVVAGTSIGSINGWFVATAQYSLLAKLWRDIPYEQIFEIKRKYRAAVTPSSGVLTRVFEAALISQGLTSNVTGLLDGTRVHDWLERNVDPKVPELVPFVFTLTNLEHQRSEVFVRLPFEPTPGASAVARERLRALFGSRIAIREVEDRHLVSALAGSSAIPIVFDPVTIEFDDGAQTYIDGGVADSAPLDLARALSRRVRLILVDPAKAKPQKYPNAALVGTVAFSIAQNRVLEASLRGAALETAGKRLFDNATTLTPEQKAFFENIFDVEIGLIRPDHELDVAVEGFDDGPNLQKTYELGVQAGLKGFQPYDPSALLR
jgi:predicted acylesterase/phospholipase RssA